MNRFAIQYEREIIDEAELNLLAFDVFEHLEHISLLQNYKQEDVWLILVFLLTDNNIVCVDIGSKSYFL